MGLVRGVADQRRGMCVLSGRQIFITPGKDIGVGVHIYIITCLYVCGPNLFT